VNQHRSGWALEIGSIASIGIRVHVTFIILLVWLVFASESAEPIQEGLFLTALFGCVLMHELGHSLVAKVFGIQTRDITLYPFGGIASILQQPGPRAELVIALAGPLVNVLIALGLYPFLDPSLFAPPKGFVPGFKEKLFVANVSLAMFNMLPALPMDGGRVLRALLGIFRAKRATIIAARISKALCIAMGLAALYFQQPMLLVIAFIIFIGAVQEHVRAESRTVAVAFTAGEAMIPRARLESIPHGTTISKALRIALTSLQPLYPVTVGDQITGVVFREDILEHAATQPDEYISAILTRSIPHVELSSRLSDAIAVLEETQSHVVLVMQDGLCAGLLVYDRVADFLLMNGIRDSLPKDDDAEWSTPL
jgi:Zn-dependent protease/CBS domain-containing protein